MNESGQRSVLVGSAIQEVLYMVHSKDAMLPKIYVILKTSDELDNLHRRASTKNHLQIHHHERRNTIVWSAQRGPSVCYTAGGAQNVSGPRQTRQEIIQM